MLVAVVVMFGCSHPKPKPVPVPPSPRPIVLAPPRWPVPVRIVTWTATGVEQVGTYPDHPPAQRPATPWFVEPLVKGPLDAGQLGKLVVDLRREQIPGLSLRGHAAAALLRELRDLPALTALVLDDTDVANLDTLAPQIQLQRLYLATTPVDDAAIARIATAHPRLEVLDLRETRITDAAIPAIASLAALRAIDLSGTAITDAGGAQLAAATHLEVVDLGRTQIAGKTLAALAKLPLRQLFIDGSHAPIDAIAQLAPIAPTLERIDISGLEGGGSTKLTDKHLAWLATAPQLIEAGLGGAQVHDPLVRKLVAIPTLRELRISEAPITAALARELAVARPELEEIDLGDTLADDVAIAALLALPNLSVLRIDSTKVTDAAFRGTISPHLAELYASQTKLTDAGLAALDRMPALEALALGGTAIEAPTLDRIAQHTKLHTLVLTHVRPKTQASFAKLGTLVNLNRLFLDNAWLEDSSFAAFDNLVELRTLHLANTSISDGSLPTLQRFTKLQELTLGDTRLSGAFATTLATTWPRLHTLSLVGLELRDPILPALAKATSLVALDLSSTEITDVTPLAALPRLRVLGVVSTKLSVTGKAAAAALSKRGVRVVVR